MVHPQRKTDDKAIRAGERINSLFGVPLGVRCVPVAAASCRRDRFPKRRDFEYDSDMVVMDQQKKITDAISVDEAAELIGCSGAHVRKLLRDGDLMGRKISARIWVVSLRAAKHFAHHRPKLGRPPQS